MPVAKLTPENNNPYMQERMEALMQAVPEAFADGKINWETLRELLGEELEEGGREEYFGLNWPGKREARRRAAIPSRGTLVPVYGEGVNEDSTENLFIEGDNLEVLKLLQKSYAGKIKMIYIDPPYNTGNDFIYNDDFTDPLEAYLRYTGAKGESGELLTTNTRADGRFHSNWLNMMYPRLILARQLLREDGVIFVSIDDNEVHHLRQLMNEIFGEENFVTEFVWEKKKKPSFLHANVGKIFDYIVCFLKNRDQTFPFSIEKTTEGKKYPLNNAGNTLATLTFPPKSVLFNMKDQIVTPMDMSEGNIVTELITPLEIKNGRNLNEFILKGEWRYSQEKLDEIIQNGEKITISKIPFRPNHEKDGGEIKKMHNGLTRAHYGVETNEDGTLEIINLFGKDLFDNPKPVGLIQTLIKATTYNDKKAIILDFFAGSSTTGQSVLKHNREENADCSFILIQFPEKIDFSTETGINAKEFNLSTITEIGKERIRKFITRTNTKESTSNLNPQLYFEDNLELIQGFKVYRFEKSNFITWINDYSYQTGSLSSLFDNMSDSLMQGWKKENLISELLLLEGFPLTSDVTYLEDYRDNEVYNISALDWCTHELYICLDAEIHNNTIKHLEMDEDDIFICLDSALTDELKVRIQDKFNVHVI